MAKKTTLWDDIAEAVEGAHAGVAQGNPICECGAVMARSWVDPHGWVCLEDDCECVAVDCSDCSVAVFERASRCTEGCERVVCDPCYERHCEQGCTRTQ